MTFSRHAQLRMQQRNIPADEVDLARQYGRVFFQGQYRIYVVGRKEILRSHGSLSDRVNGLVVIATVEGTVVTTYRDKNFRTKKWTKRRK